MNPQKTIVTILNLSQLESFQSQFGQSSFIRLCKKLEAEMNHRSRVEYFCINFSDTSEKVPGCSIVHRFRFDYKFTDRDSVYSFELLVGKYDDMRPILGVTVHVRLSDIKQEDFSFSLFEFKTIGMVRSEVDSHLRMSDHEDDAEKYVTAQLG